ncbi:MAG: LLM class flavin-dependent oxidoreductase [Actinomycetota bacterium]
MSVLIGVTLPQFTSDPERFAGAARRAEELGLDSLWVFDHMWPLSGGRDRPILECWTALAWLAAATRRIGIGSLVTRSSARHPAVLAKMSATVAAIAPGRLTVGLGTGDHQNRAENAAFGLPYLEADDRAGQLAEVLDIVRRYHAGETVTHEGRFASLTELPPSPLVKTPALWVGGRSPELLELAGRAADGWNGWSLDPEAFARDAGDVLEAAAGRPVELSWGGEVVLGRNDAEALALLGKRDPARYVVGGPDTVAHRLGALVQAGARHLVVTFPDGGRSGSFELLAGPVRAALRSD